jgi:hypothetical protein
MITDKDTSDVSDRKTFFNTLLKQILVIEPSKDILTSIFTYSYNYLIIKNKSHLPPSFMYCVPIVNHWLFK